MTLCRQGGGDVQPVWRPLSEMLMLDAHRRGVIEAGGDVYSENDGGDAYLLLCWTSYEYSPDTGGGCLFSYIVPHTGHRRWRECRLFVTKRIMIGLVYEPKAPKTKSFANLLKNMWSSHRLKSNVDPHMLVQAVSVDNVSIAAADSNSKVNIISNLQPELNQDDRAGSDDEETIQRKHQQREATQTLADERIYVEEESVVNTDFMQLTLDIPEKPLLKDQDGGLVIPQEPLVNVLRKFDGVSFCDELAIQQQQQQQQHPDTTESLEAKLARIIIIQQSTLVFCNADLFSKRRQRDDSRFSGDKTLKFVRIKPLSPFRKEIGVAKDLQFVVMAAMLKYANPVRHPPQGDEARVFVFHDHMAKTASHHGS
eukprot:scaffold13641_cov42-Cyclotella_meneghiniana.AAC.10